MTQSSSRESTESALAPRSPVRISPEPSRVIAKLFVPGEEMPENESRTAAVIARVLHLDEYQVEAGLRRTFEASGGPPPHLRGIFAGHFAAIAHRIPHGEEISERRQLLIGSYF